MSDNPQSSTSGRETQAIVLTEYEKELRDRIFANPSDWPDSAKVWIADYVSQNGLLPIGQVQGFTQFVAQQAVVTANQSTSSTTYVDLATVGPEIDGLAKGKYVILYGCAIAGAGDTDGIASLSINGAAPDDNDGVHAGSPSGDILSISVARVLVKDLTENENTLRMKFRKELGPSSVTFWQRWIVTLRIASL